MCNSRFSKYIVILFYVAKQDGFFDFVLKHPETKKEKLEEIFLFDPFRQTPAITSLCPQRLDGIKLGRLVGRIDPGDGGGNDPEEQP
jgi:hypothetical protein